VTPVIVVFGLNRKPIAPVPDHPITLASGGVWYHVPHYL